MCVCVYNPQKILTGFYIKLSVFCSDHLAYHFCFLLVPGIGLWFDYCRDHRTADCDLQNTEVTVQIGMGMNVLPEIAVLTENVFVDRHH